MYFGNIVTKKDNNNIIGLLDHSLHAHDPLLVCLVFKDMKYSQHIFIMLKVVLELHLCVSQLISGFFTIRN